MCTHVYVYICTYMYIYIYTHTYVGLRQPDIGLYLPALPVLKRAVTICMLRTAIRYVLQRVLQRVALCCSALQYVAVCCSVLQ